MALPVPASMVAAVSAPHESGAVCAMLEDGRWHFQHGPIDLIIGADGVDSAVHQALADAWQRFTQILPELVGELPLLRRAADTHTQVNGVVARRMVAACLPYVPDEFVTPMAAVAGSVADEVMTFFREQEGIDRAYVNNGGDIAMHVGPTHHYIVGLYSDLARYQGDAVDLDGQFVVHADNPVRGIATSGWRGRSFSLGIADSVTVLASDAARADVAATLIANHVDSSHPAVQRAPADTLKDDTDLGSRLVTVQVGKLDRDAINTALDQGATYAKSLYDKSLIHAAVLMLQGELRVVGIAAPNSSSPTVTRQYFNTTEGGV